MMLGRVLLAVALLLQATLWTADGAVMPLAANSDCVQEASCNFFADVLLVIKVNPVRLLWVDLLLNYYGAGFPHIVFFSALRHGDVASYRSMRIGTRGTVVHFIDDNYGFCDHETVAAASAWWPSFRGYLFLSDDVLLEFWKLTTLSKSNVWRQRPSLRSRGQMTETERKAVHRIHALLPDTHHGLPEGSMYPFAPTSGVYYVPQSMMRTFRNVSSILMQFRTYNEWGTPIVLSAIQPAQQRAQDDPSTVVYLRGKLVWGKKRFLAVRTMLQDDHMWYHPVRASSETFMRMTLLVHNNMQLTAGYVIGAQQLFSTHCLSCATHAHRLIAKKGLYHSCRLASVADDCPPMAASVADLQQYTGRVAQAAGIVATSLPTTQWVGGRVVVHQKNVGTRNPFELDHEGFWGSDVTRHVYDVWIPSLNGSSHREDALLMPYPRCCMT